MLNHPRLAFLVLFVALLSPAGFSQIPCIIGDDGFNVGCCAPPAPNLPSFPALQMQANYAMLNNCGVVQQMQANVQIAPPLMFLCDYGLTNINSTLLTGLGVPAGSISGTLLMKYSRTWTEGSAIGISRQVWRFLVNGDLSVTSATAAIATVLPPEAFAPYNITVHMVGHIDYSCDPTVAAGLNGAFSLTRLPGCIQFGALSQTPIPALAGSNATYHLVGPAPFVFAPIPAEPQGPILAEAIRSANLTWAPFSYQCRGEVDIIQGNLVTQATNCLCSTVASAPGRWKHQNLSALGCCGGAVFPFSSVPIPAPLPAAFPLPTGFVALSLGSWAAVAGSGFPGARDLTIYLGLLQYADPCNTAAIPFHAVTGVGTSRVNGNLFPPPAGVGCGFGPPNFTSFIDLQNMHPIAASVAANTNIPGLGRQFASTVVWNLNTP